MPHINYFLIFKSSQPECVNLWYFKLTLLDLVELIVRNSKGLTKSGCKNTGIRTSEFVART